MVGLTDACRKRKIAHMESIKDFCRWIGSQRRAAEALGISESQVSRMVSGKSPVTKRVAERGEAYSKGLFKKERLLWPSEGR